MTDTLKPAIVMPLHDLDGAWIAHLESITPSLRVLFSEAFISVTPPTEAALGDRLNRLRLDPFFHLNANESGSQAGDHMVAGYRCAAAASPPERVLHLCFLDRVVYALNTAHHEAFMADVRITATDDAPILFQRSVQAWASHPANYRELENMATRAGALLWGKPFDFCWCHLAVPAGQLREIMPYVREHHLSALAEIVLLLKDRLVTKEVDWLAWEDPFVLGRNAEELKHEREHNPAETRKRLAYVIPTLQVLYEGRCANGTIAP
jgi:hypothetical protein